MTEKAYTLSEPQLEAFDYDSAHAYGLDLLLPTLIKNHIGRENFSFLDIGAGNGLFSDYVLHRFPQSYGDAVDSAPTMLARNVQHERKKLHLLDAMEIGRLDSKYDVVFCNLFIHHLIAGSFKQSRDNQTRFLANVKALLKPGGRIFILEELKNGYLLPDLPNWLIYNLTSSKRLAPVTRRLGANTAGTGVCFLSRRSLIGILNAAGMNLLEVNNRVTRAPLFWRFGLGIESLESGAVLVAG